MQTASHDMICKTSVYVASVSQLLLSDSFSRGYAEVSDYRRAKIDRLRRPQDKALSLGAELLLRHALAEQGISAYTVAVTDSGKPYLQDSAVGFSLSHSGDRVMCAVAHGAVGCDLQQKILTDIRLSHRFFSAEEREYLASLSDVDRLSAFYRIWSLRESYAKATGQGIAALHGELSLDMKSAPPSLIRPRQKEIGLHFMEYPMDASYTCAVCSACEDFSQLNYVEELLP